MTIEIGSNLKSTALWLMAIWQLARLLMSMILRPAARRLGGGA